MFDGRRRGVRLVLGCGPGLGLRLSLGLSATFFVGACLAPALAAGQAGPQFPRNPLRSVTGSVTDKSREPLRGAVVQLEAGDTMAIQSYVTDERGTYRFRNLRPDADYTVWATFRGEHSKRVGMSKFDRKGDRVIPLVVRPGKD